MSRATPRHVEAAELIRIRIREAPIAPGGEVPSASALSRETGRPAENFTGAFRLMLERGELAAPANSRRSPRVAETRPG